MPFFFLAENIGGTCFCFPKKDFKTLFTSPSSIVGTVLCFTISPSVSNVFVASPNFNSAIYSLSKLVIDESCLVSFSVPIIKTPVANGSRVPPCPTFLCLVTFLIFLTTSKDVQSTGLSIFIITFFEFFN